MKVREQDGESVYIESTSKNDDTLVRVSFSQEPNQDHQSQKSHRTRSSETVSEMMSHIVILLSGFFWQVLSFLIFLIMIQG